MKCRFCQEPCNIVEKVTSVTIECCDRHPHKVTHYHYSDDPEGLDYTCNWEFKVKYDCVDWVFTYGSYAGDRKSLHIRPENVPRTVFNSKAIMFDSFCGITPENALQKLPFIITFS